MKDEVGVEMLLLLVNNVDMLLLLVHNVDVFAWSQYEVPEVNPKFIVHKFNVDPLFSPKK